MLKILALSIKFDASSPLPRTGHLIGMFLLLKNLLMIDQYDLGKGLGLSNFALILAIFLSFDPLISEMRSFD